ncbi:MAG: hypothetical protein ACK4K9_05850 [Bacteroidia bacterium]
MKKILILIILLPLALLAQKQTTNLKIEDIVLTELKSGNQTMGSSLQIQMSEGITSDRYVLVNGNGVEIGVKFKISGYNSNRSSVKAGAVKVTANYDSKYNGKFDKRTAEYIFYLDNERKFEVKETFVFKDGIKSTGMKLIYKGVFTD